MTLLAATGALVGGGSPAGADVTALSGGAFGVQVTGLLPIGPTPIVVGSSPPIAFGPLQDATVGIALPGPESCPSVPIVNILQVCAISVYTQGFANANPHLNHVDSQAAVAGVAVGASGSTLSLTGLAATCRADGNDATGATTLVNSSINVPLVDGQIAPNTDVVLDNILQIRLNEQIPTPNPHTPGSNSITVNAARITLLGASPNAGLEITLGHVICNAAGPDVNEVTPTTSGGSSTTSGGGSSTTSGGGSSTTSGGGSSTTSGGGETSTTSGGFSSVTTIAGRNDGGSSIVSGVLARTGAFLGNAFVWAALVLFLGGLALLGSRGEVQTWPPKRSARRPHGPKRSGTGWPKHKPGQSKRRFF